MSPPYVIYKTANGPVVLYGEVVLFLEHSKMFFELIDEHPQFLFDITEALKENFKTYMDDMYENLEVFVKADPAQGYASLRAIEHYSRLIYQEYPNYRTLVTMAELGTETVTAKEVLSLNSDLVNEFYAQIHGVPNNA